MKRPLATSLATKSAFAIFINRGTIMQFMSVQEFSKSPQVALSYISKNGQTVLTNDGKPTALILRADESTFEDTLLDLRKLRAKRALFNLQMKSIKNGKSEMTMDEIDAEIKLSRQERHAKSSS